MVSSWCIQVLKGRLLSSKVLLIGTRIVTQLEPGKVEMEWSGKYITFNLRKGKMSEYGLLYTSVIYLSKHLMDQSGVHISQRFVVNIKY